MIRVDNACTDLACRYEYLDVDASTNVVQRTPTNVEPNDGQIKDEMPSSPNHCVERCPSYCAFS